MTLSNGRSVPNPLATTIRFAGTRSRRSSGQGERHATRSTCALGRKFEFGARRIEASVDVFNLFNGGAFERYRTDSNQLYNPFYLVAQNLQPPRVMQLSLKFLF